MDCVKNVRIKTIESWLECLFCRSKYNYSTKIQLYKRKHFDRSRTLLVVHSQLCKGVWIKNMNLLVNYTLKNKRYNYLCHSEEMHSDLYKWGIICAGKPT